MDAWDEGEIKKGRKNSNEIGAIFGHESQDK